MAVGDRIKRARNLRGMTQKELGIAIGFEEKSADIRIAQYESNTRTPKEELLRKIAEVLDVNYRSLYEPTLYAAEDVMYTLFELDEHTPAPGSMRSQTPPTRISRKSTWQSASGIACWMSS